MYLYYPTCNLISVLLCFLIYSNYYMLNILETVVTLEHIPAFEHNPAIVH